MPVGLGTESSTLTLPRGHSPGGEINGQNIQDALTDVEDLFSDGDQSPVLKRKSLLLTSRKEMGAITDTEDTDLSGEEDDIIQEEKDVPTIQELGLLPEPNKDIINLTEGYAREASPLLHSDSEPESEAIQGKHKKNMKKIDQLNQPDTSANDDPECLTDVEDMLASGDEAAVAIVEVEDTLPDHYLDQNEGISDKERQEAPSTSPKVLLTRGEDSSGDEKVILRQPRHKCKGNLKVKANEEGTTDVEDLELSDKGDGKENLDTRKNESKDKIRKMKRNRRKTTPKKSIGKMLRTAVDDSNGLTDVEILSGDEDQEVLEDEEFDLKVPETEMGILTDSEDVELSDAEEVADLLAKPLDKVEVPLMPDPQCEKIKISEVEEASQEDSGGETDQEEFEFSKKDDAKPLNPRQKVIYEPIVAEVEEAPDIAEGTYEAALTDTEDLDINEKEEEEVITDIISRIPKEREIYTITEMESFNGQITKKEMLKDVHAETKQQIQNVDYTGLAVQEDFEDNSQTDVEDLEDSGEHGKVDIKIIADDTSKKEEGLTDEESVDESDIDEEIQEPARQAGKKSKRLPLVPQVSEVRFIETDQGPLSIIITPDIFESSQRQVPKDQITNVIFLESEEKDEATTDIEDLSDGEEEKTPPNLKVPQNKQEPTTDTEDFDIDPSEVDRPHSPLPPNIRYNVLPSPKRELIHIKEDKYGIPQVTVQKLEKDELFVSDIEDLGATDTEDIEVTEEEALRLVGVTEDAVSDFEFSDAGTTEVTTKMTHKMKSRHVEPEEGGGTDVEELPATRKPQRKVKAHSKFIPKKQDDDGHTDTELLSDQDEKEKLPVRLESPGGHTDVEDFETSENEELEVPDREDVPTPDIIRDAAIRKMIIQKEGLGGTTYTEDAHVAPDRSNLLEIEGESGGLTDVEDMEVSGAEDEIIPDHPAVDMPEYETSSVDISEKTSIPSGSNEAKHIKDNLLLPEDNFNNLTDVESLGEGEGNRCASNSDLLSGQQLTNAVESCAVDELYPSLPFADPKLCIHPGLSLESDPFCGELTNPLVVEAELEQVYYHAPQEQPQHTELELEAYNGCVIRRRQVVASTCQAREVRRFLSRDRNSPLQQTEISNYAYPATHKKGFKTILYLEQPNLLDAISISDTMCDSDYLKNQRLLEFDSSSIDSFDDHFGYRDSDIVTVVDCFSEERSSSFDDLPSPHLSSIGNSVVDSLGRSFSTDTNISELWCSSPPPEASYNLKSSKIPQTSSEKDVLGKAYFETEHGLHSDGTKPEECQDDSLRDDHPFNEHMTRATIQGLSVSKPPTKSTVTKLEGFNNTELEKGIRLMTEDCAGVLKHLVFDKHSTKLSNMFEYPNECNDPCTQKYTKNPSTECLGHTSGIYEECSLKEEHVGKNVQTVTAGCTLDQEMKMIKGPHFGMFKECIPQSLEGSVAFKDDSLSIHEVHPDARYDDSILTHYINTSIGSNIENTTKIYNFNPVVPFEDDSGVHTHRTSGSFTASFDSSTVESTVKDYESDSVSLADSALSFEDRSAHYTYNYSYHDDFSPTSNNRQILPVGKLPTFSQNLNVDLMQTSSSVAKDCTNLIISEPTSKPPLHWRHTLPRMYRQLRDRTKLSSSKARNDSNKDTQETAKDIVGVKGLIEQWEGITGGRHRSLPSSPGAAQKRFPPFEDKRKSVKMTSDIEGRKLVELGLKKNAAKDECQSHKRIVDTESIFGGNVAEEVASVCDIIQHFEGRVGQIHKTNASKPRLHREIQPPADRRPSHPRQVATVKHLHEPQMRLKCTDAMQEVQLLEHNQELVENSQMAGFVPRVMESLSITKTSREAWEEDPALAHVLNPAGTHEAAQLVEQQTPPVSYEEGLGVEEMSSVMESYTSDGSDPITTTHITRYDPDPLTTTTTTTTHTTRIIRRTQGEDGEVKEEIFEEY